MATPIKPWEKAGVVMDHARLPVNPSVTSVNPTGFETTGTQQGQIQGSGRPPLPPRPDAMGLSAGIPAGPLYGTGYSAPGLGGMYTSPYMSGGMGTYSPFTRIGMGYGGSMGGASSPFIHQAESSAQGAFQSVESVVSAVSSISMMLESTYMALNNSFRAVLGVADQFSRMHLQLSQVAATFAVFRFLRWLYRRLLVLLGLRKAGLPDDAWSRAMKQTSAEAQQRFPDAGKSSWPLIVFMIMTFGGPYLIWRMLKNITGTESSTKWADGTEDHVVGECKYDFVGERPDELTVTAGQRINLAPAGLQPRLRQNDWLLGSADGTKVGMVPASYIRILGTRKGNPETKLSKQNTTPSISVEPSETETHHTSDQVS